MLAQNRGMTWKTIRLELARTPEYPEGSAAHAYVLRLPLCHDVEAQIAKRRQPRGRTNKLIAQDLGVHPGR